jgi:ribosome-associated protein
MMAPIHVADGVVVPSAALSFRAVRSSGPGGQNVNKVASKVELRVQVDRIEGLSPDARLRLLKAAARRLDADGRLLVTSQRTREQGRNLEDAREKVRALVAAALRAPRRRRRTRPTIAARERRLQEKKQAGQRKRNRGRLRGDD